MNAPLITAPGAYTHIDAEDYHGNANLLPEPSLSSTGAKMILSQSPYHFWFQSPLNPEPMEREETQHFSIGKAAHDQILLQDRWPNFYHVLPEGFSAGATKKFAEQIAEADAARTAGKTILRHQDMQVVNRVVQSMRGNALAMKVLSDGEPEVTLAWKDERTGVWLRARPDWLPNSIMLGGSKVMILSDLKFMAGSQCDPRGFSRAVANFGYHQSLAFYGEGIKAVYGRAPTHYLLVAVEKDAPWSVSLYQVPSEDIDRGRFLNRKAIAIFADCLNSDRWPGYADEPLAVGLPQWARKQIDEADGPTQVETAWGEAA